MARNASAKKGGSRKAATADIESRLIETMLTLAARDGWEAVTLSAIAEGVRIKLSEFYPAWRSRMAILGAFMRRVDREVVETDFGFAPEDTARDRLFEVLMRRFDALQPHREAVRRIRAGVMRDPAAAAAAMRQLGCSMAWMLEAAGLASDGLSGKVRVAGLTAIWLRCTATWIDDETADMSRTMAELDRALKRADRWAEVLFCRRQAHTEPGTSAA